MLRSFPYRVLVVLAILHSAFRCSVPSGSVIIVSVYVYGRVPIVPIGASPVRVVFFTVFSCFMLLFGYG